MHETNEWSGPTMGRVILSGRELATRKRTLGIAVAVVAGVLLVSPAPQAWAQTADKPARAAGETFVSAPETLTSVLAGEAPRTLRELQSMELQQQAVARAASACTVSVQIGMSQGCGVIITGDGYVLTAAHVAMRANKDAVITLSDGRRVAARTLGLNREVDAGLVKIASDTDNGRPWPHVTLGSSKDLTPGMWCIAMGHPGGYDRERGVVARVGRILAVRPDALVTDCALIGGDSGGPLLNLEGELIGVHSRIGNDVADNLHVPVDHYDQTWNRLAKGEAWGYLPGFRPRVGVSGHANATVAEIASVTPDSPAAEAGLMPGDVIQQFGEIPVTDFASLKDAVSQTMPGERIRVLVKRGDKVIRLLLEIGRDPNS